MRILLREVRESKHISRRELAARAGVSRSWIEELECGDANPSILMLCKLAHVLEVAQKRESPAIRYPQSASLRTC